MSGDHKGPSQWDKFCTQTGQVFWPALGIVIILIIIGVIYRGRPTYIVWPAAAPVADPTVVSPNLNGLGPPVTRLAPVQPVLTPPTMSETIDLDEANYAKNYYFPCGWFTNEWQKCTIDRRGSPPIGLYESGTHFCIESENREPFLQEQAHNGDTTWSRWSYWARGVSLYRFLIPPDSTSDTITILYRLC